jgi:tRNA pseudouridine38-40 synthase
MRIALGIEYDGSGFQGWQIQDGTRTVQGCLELALSRVADHTIRTVCAGRTDAGVHATAQVVHFDSMAERSARSWIFGGNAHLPPDVSILWAKPVAPDFHARFGAIRRDYRYLIINRPTRPALFSGHSSWEYRALDVEPMREAARHLLGEHDFSSFRALACQAKSPVRTVHRLEVSRDGERVYIDIAANAFLHHMVRNIAGVLMAVGMGKRSPLWAKKVLEARDRTVGGVTAPPNGLYLVAVEYPARFGLPPFSRCPTI